MSGEWSGVRGGRAEGRTVECGGKWGKVDVVGGDRVAG